MKVIDKLEKKKSVPPRKLKDIIGDYVAFGTHWIKFSTASIFNLASFLVVTPYKVAIAPFEYTEKVCNEKWNLTALYYDILSFPTAFKDCVEDYSRFQANLWNGVGYNWLGYNIAGGERGKAGIIRMDENMMFYQKQDDTIKKWAAEVAEKRAEIDRTIRP